MDREKRFFELDTSRIKNRISTLADPRSKSWSFDDILTEINSLESRFSKQLPETNRRPVRLTRTWTADVRSQDDTKGSTELRQSKFMIQKFTRTRTDFDGGIVESYDHHSLLHAKETRGSRFTCGDLSSSDSEEEESSHELEIKENETPLAAETRLEDYWELDRKQRAREEIWEMTSQINSSRRKERERLASALNRVQEDMMAKREMQIRGDKEYQRTTALQWYSYLAELQRDHALKMKELNIRNDALAEEEEEAKRKERAELEEEKELCLERRKAEEEADARLRAEKAAAMERKAALEAKRRKETLLDAPSQEFVTNPPLKTGSKEDVRESNNEAVDNRKFTESATSLAPGVVPSSGIEVLVSESAAKLEAERRKLSMALAEHNQALKQGQHLEEAAEQVSRKTMKILNRVKNISNVMERWNDLLGLMSNSSFPRTIVIATFAEMVTSICGDRYNFLNSCIALGRLVVILTSAVPNAMDVVLAELHKVCIYTVPKHVLYSKASFRTVVAYQKSICFREEGGELESTSVYLKRLKAYMTFYASIVQTQISGINNLHGLKDGWAWLARFLNKLPANVITLFALKSFLNVAGYALFRAYGKQFLKILSVISREFLANVKATGVCEIDEVAQDTAGNVVKEIQQYISSEKYRNEPEVLKLVETESRSIDE